MNEELIPLQVWYLIKKYLNAYHHQVVNADVESVEGYPISIIENELKDAEKYKKVFDILKRKKVDMKLLFWCFEKGNCLFYNQNQVRDNKMLGDEEYELLKEVLEK